MLRAIPNFLTLCNLLAGSWGIAALFENKPEITLVLAATCLLLDVLDGLLARRLKVTGALGSQLDSLADLVSFGLLPSCILYVLLKTCQSADVLSWMPYLAFIFGAAVAFRLARFNLDDRDSRVFYGLPSPSAATFVFGLLLMKVTSHVWWENLCPGNLLYGLILILPVLMLTDLRLWSLKGLQKPNGRWVFLGLLVTAAAAMLLTGAAGILLAISVYLLFGLLNLSFKVY